MGRTIGILGFESRQGLGIFLFTTASRTALGLTQPLIQWILGAPSLEVKRQRREANHSPHSSAEVKNVWSYTSTPLIRLRGVELSGKKKKAQGQLYELLLVHGDVCGSTGINHAFLNLVPNGNFHLFISWTGRRMGHRAGLHAVAYRNFPTPARNGILVVQFLNN
jgi:hypothetical protein